MSVTDERRTLRVPAIPTVLGEDLLRVYRRFTSSAHAITDPRIAAERDQLLQGDAQLAAETLIEPTPAYVSSGRRLGAAAAELGLSDDLAGQVAEFLTPLMESNELYKHQWDSLRTAFGRQDVVVTGGTGSGKTECFWLPLITQLVVESHRWQPRGAVAQRWWETSGQLLAARTGESGRLAGMRALVMYPMNALVEDQLVRLRRVLDAPQQLQWLDRNRDGHRFTFGRYTGQTPSPRSNLKALYAAMEARARSAEIRDHAAERLEREQGLTPGTLPRYRPYVPRPLGAEQLSRPEMTEFAPDILITNFSMLNVMLMRDAEANMFTQTRDFLTADRSEHRFFLVVDELHPYRGTAGTEVALLLRKLVHRLELEPHQLTVIGASASLGEDQQKVRDYLEQFFGRPKDQFALFSGEQLLPPPETPTSIEPSACHRLSELGAAVTAREQIADEQATRLAAELDVGGVARTLIAASREQPDGPVKATRASVLAGRLDPHQPARAGDVLAGTLALLAASESQPVRAHLFFRVRPGWWACSNPGCNQVPPEFRDPRRRIGKLYPSSRIRCECGGRCLDLLCCQTCGEVMLGGYSTDSGHGGVYLLPDLPNLEEVPDRTFADQTYGNYKVYWPVETGMVPLRSDWSRMGYQFRFVPRVMHHGTGELAPPAGSPATGYQYTVRKSSGSGTDQSGRVPAIPTRCPRCNDSWERDWVAFNQTQALPVTSPRRMRTPIRHMRSAADRVSQVLTEELLYRLYPDRSAQRMIAFSDSRQDAAKLAGGLDASHYKDTVRQLVVQETQRAGEGVQRLANVCAWAQDPAANADLADEVRETVRSSALAADAIRLIQNPILLSDSEQAEIHARLDQALAGAVPLAAISERVFADLTEVGRDPAGPGGALLAGRSHWWEAYDWTNPGTPRPLSGDPAVVAYLDQVRQRVRTGLGEALWSGAGRDIESLGIAFCVPAAGYEAVGPEELVPAPIAEQVVWGAIRKLGTQRFYEGVRGQRNATDPPPRALSQWLAAVAEVHGLNPRDLRDWAMRELPGSQNPAPAWKLNLGRLVLRSAERAVWRCERCHWPHLHANAGACQHCLQPLPVAANSTVDDLAEDYFAKLASEGRPITRLATEELTAQTGRTRGQRRQALFQDIFIAGEPPLPNGIDVLSVTTTMEAGVDIGSLLAVLLANMPPQRFNYQQRVGRAGRRDDPLSVALTVCRDRTHDSYYFEHPDGMTAASPPAPYLTSDREQIFVRVIRAEALRLAFGRLAHEDPAFDPGRNVHGHFGDASVWPAVRVDVERYLAEATMRIRRFAEAVREFTRVSSTATELAAMATRDLGSLITDLADRADEQPDLSQRLAEHGLLPMFGFATQTRYLYLSPPRQSNPWPPDDSIDRDLRLAVSEFAPGNEIVREKVILTPVGLAGFRPTGGPPVAVPPLGPTGQIGLCDVCGGIDPAPQAQCPHCQTSGADWRVERLSRPAGFRTSWSNVDIEPYEGISQRLSRASTPKLATPAAWDAEFDDGRVRVAGAHTQIWQVNDNGGSGFDLAPSTNANGGMLVADLVTPGWTAGQTQPYVLGAMFTTDVMVIGPMVEQDADHSQLLFPAAGGRGQLISTARRAAWASLAFALRARACITLDIEPRELEAGVRLSASATGGPGTFTPQVFLADAIENGAGFVTFLRDPGEFAQLLADTRAMVAEWEDPVRHPCEGSCPMCLRDWSNTSFHPILDWRLAADCLEVLCDGHVSRDRWTSVRRAAVNAVSQDFAWQPLSRGERPVIDTGGQLICIVHPLDAVDGQLVGGVRTDHGTALPFDVFNFDRRPGEVYRRL